MCYESVILTSEGGIAHRHPLAEGDKLKLLHLVPNKQTNMAFMTFTNKCLVVQNMSSLQVVRTIRFVNLGGQMSPPSCTGRRGWVIPQARVVLKVETDQMFASDQE